MKTAAIMGPASRSAWRAKVMHTQYSQGARNRAHREREETLKQQPSSQTDPCRWQNTPRHKLLK
jgi:hypothetical protein